MRGQKALSVAAVAAVLVATAARAAAPPRKTPELLEIGKVSFKVNCASCHGEKGEGDGVSADALVPKPTNLTTDRLKNGAKVGQVFETLAKGVPGTAMIAFTHLPEDERWALAYYIVDLRAKAPKARRK
ncbi:MAG TPA: cytochrome c [Anaeromyxobacteraceae bacterium]|nr:cytochrome c [Anaeromyxobacteraceae bacterium]